MIGLLILIGVSAWFGLNKVDEGYNTWTWVALGLIGLTLLVAAVKMTPHAGGLDIYFTGKMFGVLLAMLALVFVGRRYFDEFEMQEWLWETWRFVKQIFPLLVVGVFAVGVIRPLIKPEWIEAAGRQQHAAGQLRGRGIRRLHVLPDAGRGADCQYVPRPGDAPRALAGVSDGRSGVELAKHSDHGQHHWQRTCVGLRHLGGALQHPGRPALWRLGGWNEHRLCWARTCWPARRCWRWGCGGSAYAIESRNWRNRTRGDRFEVVGFLCQACTNNHGYERRSIWRCVG